MKVVWLLTTGDASDGNEWDVQSIHESEESAIKAKTQYEAPKFRVDGSAYSLNAQIEEWDVVDD